ncbi:DUF6414 family protein [Aerococcus sp. 1KP-2016]|uniref:DUF6414 family protein n=1 Tax=Aerococcus sp. 1KP-2016 TaxID=1981982 RepID=UPI0018F16AAB|nr:DUF6414 family protein [Aerococcus sp. 1KP-2016]
MQKDIMNHLRIKMKKKVILRFNIKEFKNAYSLMDLLRMQLNYYAVEVGLAKEKGFNIENETDIDSQSTRITASEILGGGQNNLEETLKIYDVILAGVEAKIIED